MSEASNLITLFEKKLSYKTLSDSHLPPPAKLEKNALKIQNI